MKAFDPHVLALQFYGAVCILIQKYDMHPDLKEEGLKELRLTVSQFCKSYGPLNIYFCVSDNKYIFIYSVF